MIERKIYEVSYGFIDDDNLLHIDVYFSDSDEDEGKTVAVIDLDTGKVIFFDNRFRMNEAVKEAIAEGLKLFDQNEEAQDTGGFPAGFTEVRFENSSHAEVIAYIRNDLYPGLIDWQAPTLVDSGMVVVETEH